MAIQAPSHRDFETPRSWRSQSAASTISRQCRGRGARLVLQSDKGISLVRLAEALDVNQPTAWRVGHVLRLLVTCEQQFGGTSEVDQLYVGGSPRDACPGQG